VLWGFVFVLVAILFALIAARQSCVIEPHVLGLDFGDSPELVEYTLGLIKGIGPGTARRLVAYFGADTLKVLEHSPERLPEVPGIGQAKRNLRLKGLSGQREVQKVMVFLQGHGMNPAFAGRIYRQYGAETEATIRKNPYRLADDVFGVGFRTAYKLARELGFVPEEPRRLAAGIRFVLREAENNGHCYLPLNVFEQQASEALEVPSAPEP